jgi:hypothetical protein
LLPCQNLPGAALLDSAGIQIEIIQEDFSDLLQRPCQNSRNEIQDPTPRSNQGACSQGTDRIKRGKKQSLHSGLFLEIMVNPRHEGRECPFNEALGERFFTSRFA